MIVQVKKVDGTTFTVEVDAETRVEELKRMIASRSDISVDMQRLVFRGQVLRDGTTLSSSGVADQSVIHLIRQMQARPNQQQQQPGSLTGQLGSFQQHLLRNPDIMDQMMSSPAMQALLSNPDVMRSMMGANPQMKELMDSNPELAHLMNDPDFLKQSMDSMRNPALMREMMRNTDRAMGNIESIPGGYNALRRMYHEVQEPLWEATRQPSQGQQPSIPTISPVNPGQAPSSKPLPNPWAIGSASASSQPGQSPAGLIGGTPSTGASPFGFDPSAMAAMMQDPSMQQMMSAMFAPSGSSAAAATSSAALPGQPSLPGQPTAGHPFTNPNFLASMFNPQTMAAMTQLQQSTNLLPSSTVPGAAGSSDAQGIFSLGQSLSQSPATQFSQSFGNFTQAMQANPETRFKPQLQALRAMGFTDSSLNIQALQSCEGNLNRAIDWLIEHSSK